MTSHSHQRYDAQISWQDWGSQNNDEHLFASTEGSADTRPSDVV